MTAERLYGTLALLEKLEASLGLQQTLEAVAAALSNITAQPAQAQHQTSLAQQLNELESATSRLRGEVSPAQASAIKGLGGGDFFDPAIADQVRASIQKNPMTPSVARDFVQDLVNKRAAFLSTVENSKQSLSLLGVKESALAPGGADVAFLIPREMFDNHLGKFAKELTFINRLMEHYSEAITRSVEPPELEQLSSSIPTVALIAKAKVIQAVAEVVDKFLTAWEKIEKIRKMRAELKEMGLKGKALDELTENIETTVEEVIEESTHLVVVNYDGSPERKSELTNAVRQDTKRLFGQIERGLSIEFRASKDDGDGESREALAGIDNLAKTLKFPSISIDPLLLGPGEIIEGELRASRHTKKTTTRRTTTTAPA
jgi:hypothetical protein